MMDRVRTAVIGLGKVAETIHLPACLLVDQIALIAGCEPDAQRRELMRAKFGIANVYEDANTLIEKEKPELVIIGTPPDSHRDLSILCLQNGADVLCEKPFAMSLAETDDIIEAARQFDRVVSVNNQYRYMNQYGVTKEMLAAGDLGNLFFLQCWQQMYYPPTLEKTSWRNSLKQSTLFEFGSHPLDLICHFFDALPESVHAVIPQLGDKYDADVLVQMTLRFPGERLATIALNRVSRAPERYLEMRLDCEKASVRISLGGIARAGLELTRNRGRHYPRMRISLVKGGEARLESEGTSRVIAREPQPAFASATAAHLRKMIEMRRSGKINYEGIGRAQQILRIIFAGYESAKTGQVIRLDSFPAPAKKQAVSAPTASASAIASGSVSGSGSESFSAPSSSSAPSSATASTSANSQSFLAPPG